MSRKPSKTIEIGQIFHTWQVVSKVHGKYVYKYNCRCINCNEEKVIDKHNLLRNAYAICRNCGLANILESNIATIKNYWNYDLNPPLAKDLILSNEKKLYWFMCSKGHNFKKSIRDFSPDACPTCKKQMKNSEDDSTIIEEESFAEKFPAMLEHWNYRMNKDNPRIISTTNKKKQWFTCSNSHEFLISPADINKGKWCPYCKDNYYTERVKSTLIGVLGSMYDHVDIKGNLVIIEDIKLVLDIRHDYDTSYNRSIHGSEFKFLELMDKYKSTQREYLNQGYDIKVFNVTKNFEKDVDSIREIMLKLI